MAKTHCAVTHSSRARQRVPHISMRRTKPMLPFSSDVELLLPTQIEQCCSFLGLYLMLLRLASLLLPRSCFAALMRTALPFLPESLQQFRGEQP